MGEVRFGEWDIGSGDWGGGFGEWVMGSRVWEWDMGECTGLLQEWPVLLCLVLAGPRRVGGAQVQQPWRRGESGLQLTE